MVRVAEFAFRYVKQIPVWYLGPLSAVRFGSRQHGCVMVVVRICISKQTKLSWSVDAVSLRNQQQRRNQRLAAQQTVHEHIVNSLTLRDLDSILKVLSSFLFYWLVSSHLLMKMPSDECHGTFLKISQHWFRQWLGAVRQQAITWANVDPDLCHHMA